MQIKELSLSGSFLIETEPHSDERGFFARSFCTNTFAKQGLKFEIVQTNISFNKYKGTLRGMHYQADPFGEIKLIRCTHGAICDVIVDIRPQSATQGQWEKIELTASNYRSLYVPQGFAHGFQTLEDNTEVLYYMSTTYHAEAARGLRWNDPTLAISWPEETHRILSEQDKKHPFFDPSGTHR